MKLHAWTAITLAATLWGSAALAAAPVGQVISLEGEARAVRPDGATEQLALQSEIYLNDKVETSADSKLQIMMADDAVLNMGADSTLTIDEFVFNPAQQEENRTTVGLARGLFRVITAKVTDLNPEQFKVKSNKATIGIRGCELGFIIGAEAEDIQIVRLPETKAIYVERNGEGPGPQSLEILQQGTLVTVDAATGLQRAPLSAAEIADLIAKTTPFAVATEETPKTLSAGVDVFDEAGGLNSEAPEVAAGVRVADSGVLIGGGESVVAMASADELVQNAVTAQSRMTSDMLPAAPASEVPAAAEAPASPVVSVPDQPEPEAPPVAPSTPSTPPSPPTPGEVFPKIGTPVRVAGASGSGWSWGAWEQVDILNAAGDTRSTFSVSGSNAGVSPAALSDLLNGPSLVTLEGSIQSAAVLAMAGEGRLLTTDAGGANLFSVTAGFGALAPWKADMTLVSAQGDRLAFSANGFVNAADGSLSAPASAYALTAFGQGYDAGSLAVNQVNGTLVGNPVVNAAAGNFQFQHGAGPSVDGVFGADLVPTP